MNPSAPSSPPNQSIATIPKVAAVEGDEVRAVTLSILYSFSLWRLSVIKPVRDAMGTVYGVHHLQELFTVTGGQPDFRAPVFRTGHADPERRVFCPGFMDCCTDDPWLLGCSSATLTGIVGSPQDFMSG
jgi:hypothetical protein